MKVVDRFGSISTRILIILTLAFLLIILLVYWVIETQAKPRILEMTSETVVETGNEAINSIMASINHVDGLAKATSTMAGGLPKQDALYKETFGNLMQQIDQRIVGGGVWFDPNMYAEGRERQSFVWARDSSGNMQPLARYNQARQTPNPYYRDWWYIPAMYARHDHCVWSRAYVDPMSNQPMMTCAKALYDSRNQAFDGVVSFNLLLDNLGEAMKKWQDKLGGYVFLVDLDNRFLTFPDQSMVTQATEDNPQGEMVTAYQLAEKHPSFAPIADSLDSINQTLIDEAVTKDESRYTLAARSILSTTNLDKISEQESKLLSALLLLNIDQTFNLVDSHLVDTIAVPNDFVLQQPATAFVFRMPFTYWKMVIVKPDNDLMSVANALSNKLIQAMLLGFIPILLLTAWVFRRYFTRPLKHMAQSVADMGLLIEQKKYQQLSAHKLPYSNVSEIQIISEQTNQLIDRVVENEGALAEINVHLEKQVAARTQDLQQAMDELKTSQVHLVRSEKMATLGQMVAGVAHEVNTPLGYVRSNMELVGDNLIRFDELLQHTDQLLQVLKAPTINQEQVEQLIEQTLQCCEEIKEDEVSEDLADLIKDGLYGVDQIAELVVSLRDFSRIDESKVKDVDINDCINTSLIMARNNLKTLDVKTNLAELPPIQCNPSQVNQVLLNLFNNAAQAMPADHKGTLQVSSSIDNVQQHIIVSVKDNGVGIQENTLAKIFEPFFTTKKAGDGTGLGLAITAQIIEQHGGYIEVSSIVSEGTMFTIRLPIQSSAHEPKPSQALFES
ncbi:sensor histidine kinase [Psychrobacter cryohalolentis]|uniref:histidine kinase n=1 Tax=Psychrobacter cryohalolentis (strain ATCC BAA-1226 / DSM 17306 / VKM B-2378 / K5) TaxID=335284 RepID=Q1Q9V9_PSYCK|nr:ATP-binding protein [Psychrobacter cryohalolentis]ABE75544.1 multi-sensor signal transduction histidine kinase [Psychrobacter cryohalolentis K5]ASE25736.1 ATPase [Psychrobacter cryohalolentis]